MDGMILVKAIGGGIASLLLVWVAILIVNYWRVETYNREHGVSGLGAVAGGWNYLLQLPIIPIVLSAGFCLGFYLTVRWVVRA
jgi:hypothetical protein